MSTSALSHAGGRSLRDALEWARNAEHAAQRRLFRACNNKCSNKHRDVLSTDGPGADPVGESRFGQRSAVLGANLAQHRLVPIIVPVGFSADTRKPLNDGNIERRRGAGYGMRRLHVVVN
jgi:hypothetical protein